MANRSDRIKKGLERVPHRDLLYATGIPTGEMKRDELDSCERGACPGAGSCQGLYTANTMNCLTEVMGMSLPFCGTALATSAEKRRIAFDSGVRITELVKKNITPRKILTRAAFGD